MATNYQNIIQDKEKIIDMIIGSNSQSEATQNYCKNVCPRRNGICKIEDDCVPHIELREMVSLWLDQEAE